eukprot:5479858-Prorocentrum_lima.AAC.1
MTSRRNADKPTQLERVERADPEPRWIPEDELLTVAFPTEQRMRPTAKHEAEKLDIGEKRK